MPNGKMNCFAYTNLIVYAMDPTETKKRRLAKDFLNLVIDHHTLVLSPQSLNEFYRVVTEKRGLIPRIDAQAIVWGWSKFCTAPYDFEVTQHAWQIQNQHRYGWWDSALLASASLANCEVFLSEDMKHEQKIGSMTILNPFKLDQSFVLSR
jgi:predicted nucleic acid-binding protein